LKPEAMNEDLTIVIVDDEQPILDIFKQYLESTTSYTVLTTDDGAQALDMITHQPVDCCFLDLCMPNMDGIELASKIHQHDNTIPMTVMTGFPTMDNAIKTLKNGVVDFLTKPIDLAQISLTIQRMMREKSLLAHNILLKEEAKKNEKLLLVNQELQQKVNEVEVMNLILQELDQVATSNDLFNALVNLSGRITPCDEAHCAIFFSETSDCKTISSFVRNQEKTDPETSAINDTIMKRVANEGIPIIVNGQNGDGNTMAIPLKIRTNIFGALNLSINNSAVRFREKDLYFMNFIAEKASYLIENLALYENIFDNLFSTLYAFVETIEARDSYTKQHSTRVSHYAGIIAESMGCTQEDIDKLNVSGYLHDIGKIGIPDNILLKPGRLSDQEYEIIKNHPVIASNIISHFDLWLDEQKIIRHHHERFDGKGYPDCLKGEEIPFLSRILSVADVYDALTSDRSYRKRMPDENALKIIRENSGSQFDPKVVDLFLGLHAQGKIIFDQNITVRPDLNT
jgi:putative nucleotidyltransferase with HDIG domain